MNQIRETLRKYLPLLALGLLLSVTACGPNPTDPGDPEYSDEQRQGARKEREP